MAVVGSAEVIVRAITDQVRKDIRKAFNDARPDVQKAGRDAAKDFAGAFNQTVNQQLRPALNKTMTEAGKDAADSMSDSFSKNVSDDLGRAGEAAGRRAAEGVRRGASSGGDGGGGLFRGLVSSLGEIDPAAASAGAALTNVIAIGNFAGAAMSGLIGTLSAVVSGLFAVGSAAIQAAGALAVLPGMLAAVGQGFAAIKLGFGGVGEAIKLGAKAQDAATAAANGAGAAAAKSGRSSAGAITAAKNLQKAQDALTQAQKEARAAQEALNRAQKDAESGLEEQQRAEAALAEAQRKRSATLADPNATAQNGAEAQKAVDDAKASAEAIAQARENAAQRAARASEKNDAAQRKVAAAEAARNRARKKSEDAAKAGSLSPAAKAAQQYQTALAGLTPAARAFVEQVLRMKQAFKEVGDAVANEMFPPLTEALKLIEKSDFFDILKAELSETGGIAGEAGLQLAKSFTTKPNMLLFQRFLAGNNEILSEFTTKTRDGTTPMESLVSVFLKLGNAIQPITQDFANWIGEIVTGVDKSSSVEDMTNYFDRAGQVAKTLGSIIGNTFRAIGNLGSAAQPAGAGLLESLDQVTAKFEEWTAKVNEDGSAGEYFKDVADNLRSIGDLINKVGVEFGGLADNKGIGDMAKALEPAVENVGKIFDNFNENGDSIGKFATELSEISLAFADSKGIQFFFDTLSLILDVINTIIGLPGIKQGLGLAAGFMAISRAIQFSQSIGNKFIGGVLGGFSNLRKNAKDTGTILSRSFNGFKQTIGNVTSGIGGLIKKIPGLKGLGEKIQGRGRGMADKASAKINPVADVDPDTGDAKEQGKSVGKAIAQGMADGIGAHSALVIEAIDEMVTELIQQVKKRLDINSPSRVMHNFGEDTGEGYVQGVRSEIDDARRAGADLAGAAADGAAGNKITTKVDAAVEPAASSARSAASGASDPLNTSAMIGGLDQVDKKLDQTEKKQGKFKKGMGALGGGIKALTGGLLGLVGGPIGAIMLLVTGFTMLYQKSPEFKKFVDNIVKAVKPMVDAIGRFISGTLDKLFGWINTKMPTILRVVTAVFGGVSNFVSAVAPTIAAVFSWLFNAIKFYITKIFIPYWKMIFTAVRGLFNVVRIYLTKVWSVYRSVFGFIKKLWESVLRPVFQGIKSVSRSVFNSVVSYINKMKNAFSRAKSVMSAAKDGIVGVFNGIKNAARTPIKWVIDTVWNNGLVSMADKIPGVNAGGWRVSTKGWATGGWTGPGAKYDVAGLVHADEFVVKKSSRRRLEQMYPGLLDFINRTGSLPSAGGYADGGRVKETKSLKDRLLGGVKWTGNKMIGGVKWTFGKAKDLLEAVKEAAKYLTSLPRKISSNMTGAWGDLTKGMPKAAANRLVQAVNTAIPNGIPGIKNNPLGSPFPGVEFRANGGRVRKGAPYVVGELRPELFVPDSSGTIIPSLQNLSSKMTAQNILNQLQDAGISTELMTSSSNTTNTGSRNMTININNPKPERSTRSVTKAMREKAIAQNWGV